MIDTKHIKGDIFGGVNAGIVALPAALGFGALAGLEPIYGLYCAIFLGLFAAILGGSKTLISNPTGPMAVVTLGIVTKLNDRFFEVVNGKYYAVSEIKNLGLQNEDLAANVGSFTELLFLDRLAFVWPYLFFVIIVAAIVQVLFGILVLPAAQGKTFNELKNDYLEIYNQIKTIEPTYTDFANAETYSKEYLSYKSGIFFNIGVNYEHNSKIKTSGTEEITRFRTSSLDALDNTYSLSEFDNVGLQLPSIYKLGISFDKPNPTGKDICGNDKKSTWLAGLDLAVLNWSDNSIYGNDLTSNSTYKLSLGGEITPDREGSNSISTSKFSRFVKQLTYRGGFYYETLPFSYNGASLSEIGINFGLTIPSNNSGGLLTWNVSLASRGSELNETYIKTGLGITLNESRWFHRTKVGL